MTGRVHHYEAKVSWRGSTGAGYEGYGRAHEAAAPPAAAVVTLSSDPAFRGDPTLLNPEQLLVLSAASCQLLSFLAVAARARLVVLEYEDDAQAEMDEGDPPARINRITLRPRVVLATGPTEDRVQHLMEVAHKECFIANSLTSEMTIEPKIEFREP